MELMNQFIPIYIITLTSIIMFLFSRMFGLTCWEDIFNYCNGIYNHNRIRQYDLVLEIYFMNQSGYFRLATKLELGMGILDGNLQLCHGVLNGSWEGKINKIVQQQDVL